MRQIKVNKPIFRIHKPGDEDVEYTTRQNQVSPLTAAIQSKRQQLVDPMTRSEPMHPTEDMFNAIQARDLGEQHRQQLDPETQKEDKYFEDYITDLENSEEGYPFRKDQEDFKNGKVTPDLINRIKENLTGLIPTIGNDPEKDDYWQGEEITPQFVEEFFRRRGY